LLLLLLSKAEKYDIVNKLIKREDFANHYKYLLSNKILIGTPPKPNTKHETVQEIIQSYYAPLRGKSGSSIYAWLKGKYINYEKKMIPLLKVQARRAIKNHLDREWHTEKQLLEILKTYYLSHEKHRNANSGIIYYKNARSVKNLLADDDILRNIEETLEDKESQSINTSGFDEI